MSVQCCECDNIFVTDMSHSQWNFESSSELSFKSVQNYFLMISTLIPNWSNAMPTTFLMQCLLTKWLYLNIGILWMWCASVQCLSISHSQFSTLDFGNNHSVFIKAIWRSKQTLFLSYTWYRYASHSANCLIRYKIYEIVNVTLDRRVWRTQEVAPNTVEWPINTLRLGQNDHHFEDDIFKCIFLNENAWIFIQISLKFVPKSQIKNIPALVQIMAWHRPGQTSIHQYIHVLDPRQNLGPRPFWSHWVFYILGTTTKGPQGPIFYTVKSKKVVPMTLKKSFLWIQWKYFFFK